jgi:hypothetical protein
MQPVVTIPGSSPDPRLLPSEIEEIARFAFLAHNHDASTPARPIFWLRVEDDFASKFWN